MRVNVCGVRGSTPAPGGDFLRYGGHTSCVAVGHDGRPPTLLIDGGTGIRQVTPLLAGEPFRGTVLLGHLHWDHTQGLPFFAGADCEFSQVRVLLPEQGDPIALMTRIMSAPHFPIGPTELRGDWSFVSLQAGEHEIEGFRVLALDIPHPAGRTFGFRVQDAASAFAYLSDHNPTALGDGPDGWGPYHPAALELVRGVDVLLHDSQCTAEELPARAKYGHAAAEYAVELGIRGGARSVLLYHHDPLRTDDEVDGIVRRFRSAPIPVAAAHEGMVVQLPQPA